MSEHVLPYLMREKGMYSPMRFFIQRVKEARVTIEDRVIGQIKEGMLLFVGICEEDTKEIGDKLIKKAASLRIFADDEGKTNLSLKDVQGELLIVSQFTLYANCKKGNRPSFVRAGNPSMAEKLYQYIVKQWGLYCPYVAQGEFGSYMHVHLINDGPFTILLDSEEL